MQERASSKAGVQICTCRWRCNLIVVLRIYHKICINITYLIVVLCNELAKNLGKGDEERGDEIILSMVKYKLLALRPYSTLARDLPLEVFGIGEKEVVTLPSPGHVWAAKRELIERKRDVDKAAAELAEKAKSKPKKYFGLF
ncbi:hypothetical protein NADE_009277 [Nannochloris sp. 'desiccata']|nr:hypothetical protein NADE_009277 [Chlorella desiccata (nom. nud.)]